MKLTIETLKKLIKEALRESMMGPGLYYRREKNGDLTSLPDYSGQSIVGLYNRNIQQQISELTEDGTIEVVEDMKKGRIEFFYREGEDKYMTYAGWHHLDTPKEEILKTAKKLKEYAETL